MFIYDFTKITSEQAHEVAKQIRKAVREYAKKAKARSNDWHFSPLWQQLAILGMKLDDANAMETTKGYNLSSWVEAKELEAAGAWDGRPSPRDNPGRSTRPPGVSQATKTFEGFNEYPSKGASKFAREIIVPERMPYPGPCRWVTYRSDKWKNGTHDYIHTITSYPRVKCVMAGEDYPTVKVPLAVRNATTLTQIGLRALGFAFEYDDDEYEAKVPAGTEWFWSQTARALYLIQNKRKLIAVIWGGNLNVEPRGIVG